MKYEVIVIGCGPAGLSAGIYLGRAKVNTLVVGKKSQSQLVKAHDIQNYYGFPEGITGKELLERGIKQALKFGVKIIDNEVVEVDKKKEEFEVKLGNGEKNTAKVLIFATGTPIKLSGIENEERLTGRGVHYCIECDGPFLQKRKVAVIGNGNHAAEDALDLLIYTKDITIISNADGFAFSPEMKKAIEKNGVKTMIAKIKTFSGETNLENIILEDGKKLRFDGVFMASGSASALDFSNKLALKIEKNILVVNDDNRTSVEGVFAAGNCCARCRQVAKNVGDGCNAALSAIRFLRRKDLYFDYGSAN